jgi:hypothetical protein
MDRKSGRTSLFYRVTKKKKREAESECVLAYMALSISGSVSGYLTNAQVLPVPGEAV